MSYDHGRKAGNEGDVVKHVALVALLETILGQSNVAWSAEFKFADLYAGYAASNLPVGGGWPAGIGKVVLKNPSNPHVLAWRASYLGDEIAPGDSYPGSTLIARDVILRHKCRPRIRAWDIHPGPLGNLLTVFGAGVRKVHGKKRKGAAPVAIYCKGALWTSPNQDDFGDVLDADFILLDPPDVDRGAPDCLEVLGRVRKAAPTKPFLLWLPVNSNSASADWGSTNAKTHLDVMAQGWHTTIVLWKVPNQQGPAGCQLIYPFQPGDPERQALAAAVDDVVTVMRSGPGAGPWNITMPLHLPGGGTVSVTGSVFHSP